MVFSKKCLLYGFDAAMIDEGRKRRCAFVAGFSEQPRRLRGIDERARARQMRVVGGALFVRSGVNARVRVHIERARRVGPERAADVERRLAEIEERDARLSRDLATNSPVLPPSSQLRRMTGVTSIGVIPRASAERTYFVIHTLYSSGDA